MPDIDNNTLLIALQAVYESINRYDALLESETLSDPENIAELLVTYDEALSVLKDRYMKAYSSDPSLPPIESLLQHST